MDLSELTLLNDPPLILTILKAAEHGAVSLEDCLQRLNEDFARAKEPLAPMDIEDLLARMSDMKRELIEASCWRR